MLLILDFSHEVRALGNGHGGAVIKYLVAMWVSVLANTCVKWWFWHSSAVCASGCEPWPPVKAVGCTSMKS